MSHLDEPFRYNAFERDLAAAIDERDAIIARQRERLIEAEARRAGPPFAFLVLVVLPWWGLLCVSLRDGWGWQFFGLSVLALAVFAALVRLTRPRRTV